MQSVPPGVKVPEGALRIQVYTMTDTDGYQYRWNSTMGLLLAQARGEVVTISLSEIGITLEFIRAQYEGMDEMYALTTNLSEPLLFVPFHGEVVLVDGWNRLFKAAFLGEDILPAYVLTQAEADLILIDTTHPGRR